MRNARQDVGPVISRRRLLALGAAVAGAPRLAWGQARRGGALKVQQVADIVSVNPYLSRAAVDRVLMDTLFSGLLAYDPQMSPIPDLAESWSIPDDRT